MQGYPPGYDPSMDPTLSGMGGYQVGMDPMAGSQMAPAPGMGSLGSTPSGAMSNIQLSGGDQFALGAAQAAEMGTNAFFLTAMSSPILRASGHRGLAAVGRVTGAMDPFRMLGMGHRGVVAPAFNALSGGAASRGFGAGMRGLARGGAMRMGGRMALMGGAAASGYGIPIAAAMAVMEAPIMYAEQMGKGIKDQYTGMATMASAAPAGMHYTGADAKAFGFHGMPQMAKSMGMDMGGMQDLIGALGQQGTFNGARDMQQFSAKLRGALQQLKDVARETDSTLAEANQMIQGLNAHGFQGGQLRQAAMSVSGRGQLSGLGQDAIYASGTMGSDVGRQLGLNRQMMFNQFATGASTMAYGERTGRIDSNLVNFFGGAQQASAMVESQAAQGFMGSSLMAYAMDPRAAARGQSVVNQERLQQVLGGNVNASMLQTVTPEMVNASLQERARHVLMPHAQQAITQFGLAGGASDATASARMTAMGYTSSPEQALLMLQQRQAASFESTALEAQNSRRTALAQQAAIQDSLPGAITRAYRDSGLGELAHSFAQSGRNAGRNLAASLPDLFTPNDVNTDRSVTAGGLESARRLTSAQLGMYEDYTSGNMTAFGGGRYSPGSMYSGGFLQGSSGLMTAGDLTSRGLGTSLLGRFAPSTADFFEAGEDQLNARHAVLANNPVLARQMARADVAGMKSLGIGKNQLEGRDFVRTESPALGHDFVIRADTLNAAGDAYSRGVASITGGGQRGTDAREMLKASLYVNRAEGGGGSARTSYVRAGRNMGILSRRGFGNVSSQERAALVLREQVLRRSGVVEDSVSESMYAGMGRNEQVEFMTGLQGQLDEASGYDSGLRDLIGSTGNARGFSTSDIELSTEAVSSVGRSARASFAQQYRGVGAADLEGFSQSFERSPEFREAFADMIELANTVESRAEGAKGYTAANRDEYMRASFTQGQAEMNEIAARFRDTSGGEALRVMAQRYGAIRAGTGAVTNNAITRLGTSQDAELVRASGAIEQYHRASDPAMRRLTERITDFNYRHQKERVSGSDKGFEEDTQAFRDSMREASGFAMGLYEDEAAESASYDRHTSFMSENFGDGSHMGLIRFNRDGEFGGVTVGDKTVAFTSQQQLNDFIGAKRGSVRMMRDTRDRFDHSTYGQEAEGSVGQEFYRAIGGMGQLEGSSPAERLRASQELISSMYDYQGDQVHERELYARAVGSGRAEETHRMVGQLLGAGASTDARADALRMLREKGKTTAESEQIVAGITASESEGNREESLRQIFEALGQRLDQTLVSESERKADTASVMAEAAATLLTAGQNLQIAAQDMGGPPGESYVGNGR